MSLFSVLLALLSTSTAVQEVEAVKVVSQKLDRAVRLPGELLPYQSVDIHARVAAFVERVSVDRGSVVKEGDLLVSLGAPELQAQLLEAEARFQALEAQGAEAAAKAMAAETTYTGLKAASETSGAVAGNELVLAEKSLEAARATLRAVEMSAKAAAASATSLKELTSYLRVLAPFDGTVIERLVHPGALVGPGAGSARPLLRLEQLSRLRLVVAVPETHVEGIARGGTVEFTTSSFPGETFSGVVARVAGSMDVKTRTMPVEVDVANPRGRLAPGMYPEVQWPVRRARASLLVPATSVAVTTERSFVIRVREGRAEWVDVKRGAKSGALTEVFGPLQAGDLVLKRATDEIRDGSTLTVRVVAAQ